MRVFVFTVALFVTVSAGPVENNIIPNSDGYQQGTSCPNVFFYDGCSLCICKEDGKSADCILLNCPPEKVTEHDHSDDDHYPHIDNFDQVGQCHAGESFWDVCNLCQCSDDGFGAVCNRMGCDPIEKPHIDGYKQGMKCVAGKVFYDECKTCNCSADGVSAECSATDCESTTTTATTVAQ